jgi:hypothetical protein
MVRLPWHGGEQASTVELLNDFTLKQEVGPARGPQVPKLPEGTLRSGRHNKATCDPNDLSGNPG